MVSIFSANPPKPATLPAQQITFLTGRHYACRSCQQHLAKGDDIISKMFMGRMGRAYLFKNAHNITIGHHEKRNLITGQHVVADIKCTGCLTTVGWTYVTAYEKDQKYKEGTFIIEQTRVTKENGWMDEEED